MHHHNYLKKKQETSHHTSNRYANLCYLNVCFYLVHTEQIKSTLVLEFTWETKIYPSEWQSARLVAGWEVFLRRGILEKLENIFLLVNVIWSPTLLLKREPLAATATERRVKPCQTSENTPGVTFSLSTEQDDNTGVITSYFCLEVTCSVMPRGFCNTEKHVPCFIRALHCN